MRISRLWLTDRGAKSGWPTHWQVLALLFLSLSSKLIAQDPNNNYCVDKQGAANGGFTLSKTRICAGEAVEITGGTPAGLSNIGYIAPYGGRGIPTNVQPGPTLQFTTPGSFTILQVGTINGLRAIACQAITVLPLDAVKFTAKACSGLQALVDVQLDASTSQYDSYVINWGDGQNSNPLTRAEILTQQAHTYGNAGVYSIRITGRYAAPASCETPLTASQATLQTVTVSNASARPAITKLTTNSDNSISINYQAGTGASVELYQKDASGIFGPTGQRGTGTGTFLVRTTARQVECFQLVAQDACNSAGQRSDEVCSLVINAQAGNKRNDVSWQPYAGTVSTASQFRRYRIYRNNAPLITLLDRNIANHVDINKIECGAQYCYTLEATITGTVETVITSAPVCVTGVNGDLPGNFESVIVSIENGRPRLVASLPITGTSSSYTLAISRASGASGSFQPIGSVVNRNTFVDSSANTSAGSYCYQLTYLANCGLSSPPSSPVCTVFLGSQSPGSIDWTGASPFLPGSVASYTVEVIDSLNGTKQEIQAGGNLRFEPPSLTDPASQSQKYRIVAVSNNGRVSYSNFFTLQQQATILTPDAFTPNGDGTNDVFTAKGVYADRFSMTIYNRWGEVIYATSDKNQGWDGTASSQPAAAGHYMYRIEVQDASGLKTVRSGTVLLIR